MSDLGSLLGRWHQWRRAYSVERGYARLTYAKQPGFDDELERLQMESIERAVAELPRDMQLAIQHWARAEAMGVEVIHNPHLGPRGQREELVTRALRELHRRLVGVL